VVVLNNTINSDSISSIIIIVGGTYHGRFNNDYVYYSFHPTSGFDLETFFINFLSNDSYRLLDGKDIYGKCRCRACPFDLNTGEQIGACVMNESLRLAVDLTD
jgi:hypothetical protein